VDGQVAIRRQPGTTPDRRQTDNSDPVALLALALDQAGTTLARVRPEQATLPTPCRSWDVRGLVDHVVRDVRKFTVMARGGAWDESDSDLIGDDWAAAYREAAASLLEVWRRPAALDGTVRLPFGEVPASWQIHQVIADLAVHAWDVAKATGQPTDLDPEIGQVAFDWGRGNLGPRFRGDEASGQVFGPEVPVPDDAPLYDRLAGWFGRDPR
jgi:uncharacterized protein (TIGR03086 family)